MNYKVYQGTELKQTVTSKTAVMNGLQPNRTYEFGVQPNDGNRDGTKVTTSVTTRGIRFNIPKTLTVGSNITLRYEEYPLGIVPIGNEPSGYFGGGNKQNLSAKVISTANGSSVVEVGGNVIEVGGKNLLVGTSERELSGKSYDFASRHISGGLQPNKEYTLSGWGRLDQTAINNQQYIFVFAYTENWSWAASLSIDKSLTVKYNKTTFTTPSEGPFNPDVTIYLSHPNNDNSKDSISGMGYISKLKLETGDTATPYASFVDGDTFAAQPDGTLALFSEQKAIYY